MSDGSADEGWRTVTFGDFLTPNKRPYTLGADEDADLVGMRLYGAGPFHRELKQAAKIRKKSHFVIKAGDVIYNKLFAWKGTFGIVPPELDGMFVSDKFPTYELDESQVDPRYLAWFFRTPPLWEQARRLSTGSAALSKLTLNPPKFLQLTMQVPNLPAQREIVDRLASLDDRLVRVQALRSELQPTANALLLALIERRLEELRERFEPRQLAGVVEEARGISYGIVQTGAPTEGGVPTLRAGDVRQFDVRLSGVKRVAPEVEAKFARTRLTGHEVLLRIRGGLGEVATCPPEMVGGNVSREVAVIPLTDELLPEYVMYALAAPSSQDFLRANVRGTSYVGINLTDVRRLEIPVPRLDVQASFVEEVDSLRCRVGQIEHLQESASATASALLPSLVDRLLSRPAN